MTATALPDGQHRTNALDRLVRLLERLQTRRLPAEDQEDVAAALDFFGKGYVSTGVAAQILGVSSRTTVKNWARDGRLPGGTLTKGGQWKLPLEAVVALRAASLRAADANASGTVRLARHDGPDPFVGSPLRSVPTAALRKRPAKAAARAASSRGTHRPKRG